jgi:hypothetical protein
MLLGFFHLDDILIVLIDFVSDRFKVLQLFQSTCESSASLDFRHGEEVFFFVENALLAARPTKSEYFSESIEVRIINGCG